MVYVLRLATIVLPFPDSRADFPRLPLTPQFDESSGNPPQPKFVRSRETSMARFD